MDGSSGLVMMASAAGTLVHVAFAFAFLIAGATTVRRAHAGAGWLVVVAASIDLATVCLGTVGQFLAARGAGGLDLMMQRTAMLALLGILLGIASSGALLAALIPLACPRPGAGIRGD